MPRVLIVEDDEAMAVALRDGFTYEGYEVRMANDGASGLRLAAEGDHDLIIMDVMLPRMNGLDICRRIRRDGSRVPLIMLTARGQEIDKVLGLKTGADDYVTKPFSFLELMARVEALLRRSSGFAEPVDHCRFGDVEIDFRRAEARKGGRTVVLSPREFKLIQFLVEHRGEVVTRERLLDAVWGYENVPFTRTVDMHIAKLRKKIEDRPHDPEHIVTVHRVGYKFTG
ncbi:MAG TPA: response regulator transcription factor [Candidatus Polarisedimenticolaceae bacterium]|nr:response regulator transcription factor [Candidatus Polarisedimenticolaceae bacterium]